MSGSFVVLARAASMHTCWPVAGKLDKITHKIVLSYCYTLFKINIKLILTLQESFPFFPAQSIESVIPAGAVLP